MMTRDFHDRLLALGFAYVDLYRDGKFTIEMLVNCPSIRKVVLTLYYCMLGRKEIHAIETLELQTKNQLWEQCKPFVIHIRPADRVDFARCYWTLDQLAAKKEEQC